MDCSLRVYQFLRNVNTLNKFNFIPSNGKSLRDYEYNEAFVVLVLKKNKTLE